MPKRALFAAAIALMLLLAFATPALAKDPAAATKSPNKPDSIALIEDNRAWDGKTVTFTGEAIGEAMRRGDYAWIHINDDPYYKKNVEEGAMLGGYNSGMAVWIRTALVEPVRFYGDYKHEGDIVTVTGTFNRACTIHGGDLDIHATALKVDVPGHVVVDVVKPAKIGWALGLAALAALFWWIDRNWKPDTAGFWERMRGRS